MSKERARRRAEQRAQKARPKTHPAASSRPPEAKSKPKPTRSRREQRRRQRLLLMAGGWIAVNAIGFLATMSNPSPWAARWVILVLSTIAVPVIVWLVWDPEGRVDL
ncbi:MAG: hypothetical protein OEV62_12435 [Actinomycetota bacterium]|nr:hypothetical protein [Actinomycetota bacterium]HUW16300.1 hypothetical protein [Actinomycetes bacterium]